MCVVRTYSTVGPMGAGRSPLGLLLSFHSRFLGLNAEAKKQTKMKKKKNTTNTNEEGNIFQQCNSVCFVSMCARIHSVSSFNDDDFTKTVFIIRGGQSLLVYRESTVCVFLRKHGGIMGTRQGREPNRVSLYLCACSAVTDGIIA